MHILDISFEEFFDGIVSQYTINNKRGSIGGNVHVENLYAANKDKSNKIEALYEQSLRNKDIIIEVLREEIALLRSESKTVKN